MLFTRSSVIHAYSRPTHVPAIVVRVGGSGLRDVAIVRRRPVAVPSQDYDAGPRRSFRRAKPTRQPAHGDRAVDDATSDVDDARDGQRFPAGGAGLPRDNGPGSVDGTEKQQPAVAVHRARLDGATDSVHFSHNTARPDYVDGTGKPNAVHDHVRFKRRLFRNGHVVLR